MDFPETISGFSRVEYLSVFVALLYAFAVAEFFFGWSRMLRLRSGIKFSFDHLAYSFIYFWVLLINWYTLWPRMEYLDKGFVYFLIILVPTIITYVASVFMFPDFEKERNLIDYFDTHFKHIAYSFAIFILSNVVIGVVLGEITAIDMTVISRIVNGSLLIIVATFDLKKLRRPLLVFLFLGLLSGTAHYAFI